MINNPYRKAVNVGGTLLGLATLIGTGVAAHLAEQNQSRYLTGAPNYGLHDGVYRVETPCIDADFCPIRTLAIDVSGGQIVNIDVAYHNINRNSHSRNTSTVQSLTQAAIRSQNADNLDLISGATVTSLMFKGSLQEAINAARS